ncbi:dynein axonemal intermediate chain 7 [Sphaeramia orbicularis]|uniref:dynein axonemal intermediate chain 7 n=1 Tax=Sphaeramia orbicularis TaxID=375764 RepID=UPI00117CD521|nr:protein CASC1 [Sphaeramia orbicularis]
MSSKKQGRLTKAQKAKLQKEEEERRLQEEEEARLQAEKEEQERQERERKEQELEKLELKDLERRKDELNELRHLLEENHTAVTNWKADAAEKAKWERYMRCDGTPDPAVQQEINTYISLWRDDPQVNITHVLEQCKVALQLTDELEDLHRDGTDLIEGQKYQEAFIDLQELIHSKHNLATEEILKEASANIDIETGNMQTVVKDENVTLCLWANIKKNPRFKGFTFEEVSLGFELPKQLAVKDIAIRILHTHYDHLSSLARMAHLKIQTPSHRCLFDHDFSTATTGFCSHLIVSFHGCGNRSFAGGDDFLVDLEETKGEEEEEVTENETVQQIKADEEEKSVQESEGGKSTASLQSRTNSTVPVEGQQSQIPTQMETLCAEGELTSPAVLSTDHRERVVDLMQYTPLGGVFFYDVFHLPPQAHKVNGWVIRQILDTGLQIFPYPNEQSQIPGSVSSKLDDSDVLSCSSVRVSVMLPDSVVFVETPKVACWDGAGKQWRMEGITDISYREEESRISFKMDSFQTFVLVQDIYANFPFLSWELRPLGQDSALFTVKGALIDLSITIQSNQCMLQSDQAKGLSHLTGKWMSGPALQRAMLNTGINIFVNEFTEKYVKTYSKDPLTEHSAYEQMALFASACAFSWSKWNAKCGPQHLVMQVCEHLSPTPVPKDLWTLYLLGAERSQKLEIIESSDAFCPDHCPGSEFHSTFIHMLQDNMSTEGIVRTRESNYLFVDTVQSLLCSTRPLMYS